MRPFFDILARNLIGMAVGILPSHRLEWRDAMLAEFMTISDPPEALAFAAGCLRASLVQRNAAMTMPHRLLFLAALAIPGSLAAVALWSASKLASAGSSLALLFVGLGAIYAGVAVWTLLRSHHALITASSAVLALCVALFFVLTMPLGLEQKAMYRALVTESMVIWLVLLGLGVAIRRLADSDAALI